MSYTKEEINSELLQIAKKERNEKHGPRPLQKTNEGSIKEAGPPKVTLA